MIYRCKSCGLEEARGCLPTATCGVYLFGLMGLWIGGAAVALRAIRRMSVAAGQAGSPPRWAWLLMLPLGVLFAVLGVCLLQLLLAGVEWLVFAWRRCPQCGSRRWSRGFTRGFGL